MTNDIENQSAAPAGSLIHNWISLAGIVLAASSFFAVACLIALDYFRGFRNPYVGILTYVVAPAFLVAGLLLISAGALWKASATQGATKWDFEFSSSRFQRAPATAHIHCGGSRYGDIFAVHGGGSYRTNQLHPISDLSVARRATRSCARIHGVPGLAARARRVRPMPHRPGRGLVRQSKLSGAYQVYTTLSDKYPRPIPTPIENLRPAHETCEQCHWPKKFYGAAERTFTTLSGQTNRIRRGRSRCWMKIGGRDPEFGTGRGIHWHMNIANKIEYIATDKERQVIPWVRLDEPARQSHCVSVYATAR